MKMIAIEIILANILVASLENCRSNRESPDNTKQAPRFALMGISPSPKVLRKDMSCCHAIIIRSPMIVVNKAMTVAYVVNGILKSLFSFCIWSILID